MKGEGKEPPPMKVSAVATCLLRDLRKGYSWGFCLFFCRLGTCPLLHKIAVSLPAMQHSDVST